MKIGIDTFVRIKHHNNFIAISKNHLELSKLFRSTNIHGFDPNFYPEYSYEEFDMSLQDFKNFDFELILNSLAKAIFNKESWIKAKQFLIDNGLSYTSHYTATIENEVNYKI